MRRLLPVLALLLLLLVPAEAGAKPNLAGTFDLSGTPGRIARGSDGNVWVTLSGSSLNNTLARIKPNGHVTEYSPLNVVNPVGITGGPDGNLWLTRNNGVVRVPPDDPDSAQDFTVTLGQPQEIVSGPGNKLWTASADQLVSFKPGNPTGFDSNTINGMGARGIAVEDGDLWIADFGGQRIIRSTPSGNIKKFNVGGGPQQVASGPDHTIAYGNPGDNPQTVGRIKDEGKPKTTEDPMSDPFGMRFADDGNWWFAEFARSKMGILSTKGKIDQFDLPNNSGPRYVTKGPDHTLWVSLEGSQQIARIKGVK